ncbi:MAG: prepilin-type N-terminal cleavage/methylation domain-containing protein [Planctomycetota bacterium]
MRPARDVRRDDGFSMIELMLVVVVIAVGTMTMTSGILVSKSASMELEEQALVRAQTREIIERVRALDFGVATDTVAEVTETTTATTGQLLDLISPITTTVTSTVSSTASAVDDTVSSLSPSVTISQLRTAGNLTWSYDISDLSASTSSSDLEKVRLRRLSIASRRPWEMEVVNDLDGDGSSTGAFENDGGVAVVEIRYGGKVRARVVVAADPED